MARLLACVLVLWSFTPSRTAAQPGREPGTDLALRDASRQGPYLVGRLTAYAGRYWARVAGRDTDLPPHVNGHDELAAAWTHEVLTSLHGLGATGFAQTFPAPGFVDLPAERRGANIVVTVAGSRRPDRAVIIGAHYDGEPDSRGSAYDDTSGAVILLGLARTLGRVWRAAGPPSVTVQLVLFDAEEEGLAGSGAYRLAVEQGAIMPHPILMIDEEQSGVGYPARPFGLRSRSPMPAFTFIGAQSPPDLVGTRPAPSLLTGLQGVVTRLEPHVFAALRTTYRSLSWRDGRASAFTSRDRRFLNVGPATVCCSDNSPFDLMGVPAVTLSGDSRYYTPDRPSWSFPFDQPGDTVRAMACDTGGAPTPKPALAAALSLPLALSTALVMHYAPPARGKAVEALSDIASAGSPVHLQASGGPYTRWTFGDGTTGTGSAVRHVYARAGTYDVTVTSAAARGTWTLTVHDHLPTFVSPFQNVKPPPLRPWNPPELRDVAGCH